MPSYKNTLLSISLLFFVTIACNSNSTTSGNPQKTTNTEQISTNQATTTQEKQRELDLKLLGSWEGDNNLSYTFREDGTCLEGGNVGEYEREWRVENQAVCLIATESGMELCFPYSITENELVLKVHGHEMRFSKI